MATSGTAPCRACGHERFAHLHYRRGLDCNDCGCMKFRSQRPWLAAVPPRPSRRFVTVPAQVKRSLARQS
jgi:hypothetical protein